MPAFEFLGPYRIGEPLGRGGMGTVFAAVHVKTGEPVAVKLIAQNVSDDTRFRRRFHAEFESLQRLKHEGIVRPLGVGEHEGQLFYSMELVQGESLQARIRREKKLHWRPTLDIAIQVCAALKHAHDIGVIHRDLKPANLMITPQGKVKLVDFGIAKIFGEGEQTMAGAVLGTADYMAPEQATGSGVTAKTDLYSLGSVMYAMLTGRPPFTGKKFTEVIDSLKRDRPVPLDLIDPELPEALVELIHQLLEKDPARRPPTALSVMNRLKAMRAGLDREQTVVADNVPTQLSQPEDPDSRDTSLSGSHDSAAATDVTGRHDTHKKRTVVSKGGAAAEVKKVGEAPTVVSAVPPGLTVPPPGSPAEVDAKRGRTHFQTASETPSRSGVFQPSHSESSGMWAQWLTVAGMIAILLVGGALLVHAMLPPTADELYELAIRGNDSGAAKTFLRRFPEDARFDEVHNHSMAGRLRGVLKRLETQQRLGIALLEPPEEAFLNAMNGRELAPVEAMNQLQQWRSFYDTPANQVDRAIGELIELARHEEAQLATRAPAIIVDPRAEALIGEIRRIVAEESPEEVLRKLTALVNLHGEPWAKPAVDEARRQLESQRDSHEPTGH